MTFTAPPLFVTPREAAHRHAMPRHALRCGASTRAEMRRNSTRRNGSFGKFSRALLCIASHRSVRPRYAPRLCAARRNGSFVSFIAAPVSAPLRAAWCRNDAPRNSTVHLSISSAVHAPFPASLRVAPRRNATLRDSTRRFIRQFLPQRLIATYRAASRRVAPPRAALQRTV